ncbi:uncharacterized protein [Prorops nasuta]|uniref:uncharacterized protein n=1 Tax=Prorops nasuta TaxID=863751 RepID=UPI0034CFEC69
MDKQEVILVKSNDSTLSPASSNFQSTDVKYTSPDVKYVTPDVKYTPTGKISHAKTRVYIQRYRKEWEQMPDFEGWLTSDPLLPTRAYCLYCKKNLHAHRLSLLKHTCTMKHQRAALMHQAEKETQKAFSTSKRKIMGQDESSEQAQTVHIISEENDDDIEYVVESLDDIDDDQMGDMRTGTKVSLIKQEEIDEEDEEDEEEDEENEDSGHLVKKIKLDVQNEGGRDTLAEAMAHVHGEFLEDSNHDQSNVQLEMVVESDDQSTTETQGDSTIVEPEATQKAVSKKLQNAVKNFQSKVLGKPAAKEQEESKGSSNSGIVVACPLPVIGTTTYQNVPTGTIGVLQPVNTIPIAPAQNKTITLTSGGKTLTLTGGTFASGGQLVLSKVKGKFPTLVMMDKQPVQMNVEEMDDSSNLSISNKTASQSVPIASTSQETSQKVSPKTTQLTTKKPRISTIVTDNSKGIPIGGLQVSLYKLMDGRWTFLNESNTNPDGRCTDLADNKKIKFTAGRYKLHFDVDKYFTLRRIETMYPFIEIVFDVKNASGHYHIPLILSPFGYTTYRGSEN